MKHLFHHMTFQAVDPLANGLDDEIAAERMEPEAIGVLEDANPDDLAQFWDGVVADVEQDPSWFSFSNNE